ncbi:glycosyltransferase [Roseimaritima ulvae]|uniref:Glycogen synthase n=1 Tax=Roseimaritima ulvae TaxID=980254 RepID=A0A5B9QSB6_9BACT|nr:glycosyltransferase [Roseimaritima ulvae]QEG41948.1 Glycogen synthase [Roseimaritima ulvae]
MSTVSASATAFPTPVVVAPTREQRAAPPQPISVLHVVNGEHFSGAERVQSHLGRCLPALQVRADFACVKPALFADHIEQAGGELGSVYRLPMRGRMDFRVAYKLSQLVRREGYELLHAHTPRTAVLAAAAARLCGVPWIYHVHSPAARDSARPWVNRINAVTEWLSLRNCAHLITVSNSLLQDTIQNGWPAHRASVVHNGVPAIRPTRTHTPVVGGPWVLGMVALMRPRKGLEIAIEAISHLKNTGHDVRLRCIGPFETQAYRKLIDAKVEQLQVADRIEFTGFAKHVPEALAQLDAMVLPSLYGEGLPMVVLEAMAAALPVVATRVEGTPEAIRHGREGLLAEPQCSLSLAEQITALVEGQYDWQQLAEAACQRHAKHFSDTAMAEGTAAVYRDVLSR